jgi:hypothetical protein
MIFWFICMFCAGWLACRGVDDLTQPQGGRRYTVATEIIRITSGSRTASDERVPLFYIDDTEYTMLAHPRPSLLLEYMDTVRERGLDAAIALAASEMIGRKGWEALKTNDDVSDEQVAKILQIVMETVTAERPEAPKSVPPPSNGTVKSAGSPKSRTK